MDPPSATAGLLTNRPSSSSGPGTLGVKRTDFDKRKSRDDLYLMTMTAEKQNQKQHNFRSFHTPNRNRVLAIDITEGKDQQSERYPPESTVALSGPRPGHLHTQGFNSNGPDEVAIGMALGSPAHPPVGMWSGWHPQQSLSSQQAFGASPLARVSKPEAPGTPEEPPKPRGRKWSLFSRSKSKKGKTPTVHEAHPQTAVPPKLQKPHPPSSTSQQRQRQQSDAGYAARTSSPAEDPRPKMGRQGSADSHADSYISSKSKHNPISVPFDPSPTKFKQGSYSATPPPTQRPIHRLAPGGSTRPMIAPSSPLLDVQIPDITMERYSVMFGQVLKRPSNQHPQESQCVPSDNLTSPPPPPQQQQQAPPTSSSSSSSSSLLARRQATLGRLKTIQDEVDQSPDPAPLEPPRLRRASSPHGKQSPALYLFPPSTEKTAGGARPVSPRTRSFTSPAGMAMVKPMPLRPPPEPPMQSSQPSRAQTFPSIGRNANLNDNTMSSSPQGRPRLASKFQRRDSHADTKRVDAIVESPSSMSMSMSTEEASPRLTKKEPAQGIVTPPTSTTDSRASTPKKDSLSSIASESITVVRPPQEAEDDKTTREAVQASITRQISVSREQREMLRPFRSQSRHGRKGRPLGPENIVIGENERIAETKKATPLLVHPDPDALSPKSNNVYRRSEQVVFEGA